MEVDLLDHLKDAPLPNLLIIAGLIFLGIAVVGRVSGKIEPSTSGRIMSGVLGFCLLIGGIYIHSSVDEQKGRRIPSHSESGEGSSAPQPSPGQPPPTSGSAASGPAQGFRVVEVILRADPFDFTGACPATINFSGRISVVGGSGRVSYKFLRNDGASAPVESLSFDSPGSKDIHTTWTVGGPGLPVYSGWEAVQILEPQAMKSNQAPFKIHCQ
jgi:hypothetical protein